MDFPFSSRFTLASTITNSYKSQLAGEGGGALGAEESMAKTQNSEEEKICHWISTCNPGIGIHMFVPMMLVSLALIIRQWEAVREILLSSIPICCFTQVELQRLDSVFWLILCNIIILLLSIQSGLFCVTSSTDQYGDSSYSSSFVQEVETWPKQQNPLEGTGMEIREAPGKSECIIESGLFCVTSSTDQYGDLSDSSSFVQEIETWPKQQNPLEGTGMEIREAPGKSEWIIKSGLLCVTSSADQYGDSSDSSSFVQEIETWPKQQNPLEETGMESRKAPGKSEWINSISMSLTVTQPEQKQPSAKRNRTRINGMRQGKRQDDSDMKNSMALHQAIV